MSRRSSKNEFPEAPGPQIRLRQVLSGGDPEETLRFFLRSAGEYGPVVRFRVLGRTTYLLDDADLVVEVLRRNARNYRKSKNYEPLRLVVGDGLLTSEGDTWRRQRQLVQPAFHHCRIDRFADLIVREANQTIERWRESKVPSPENGSPTQGGLDIAREMSRLTLSIVGKALLGSGVEEVMDRIYEAQSFLNSYVDSKMGPLRLPAWVPTAENRRYRKAVATINGIVYGLVGDRRARRSTPDGTHEGGGDILSLLLEAQDEKSGQPMTDRQLRDEVVTILLAGNETTANALAWTWYLLSEHPEAEATLHSELDQKLVRRNPTLGDLQGNLPYVGAVFREAMRLYPPAWAISRRPIRDEELSGFRIPADSTVIVSPYVTHRNPRYWQAPEQFRPERFLEHGALENAREAEGTYFPFGAGPRKCVGHRLAMMEGQLILATIARHYSMSLSSTHRVGVEPVVTLRPRGGLPVHLTPR